MRGEFWYWHMFQGAMILDRKMWLRKMPIGRIIMRILGMKCYDLLYLWNFSRDHLRLAEIDRCKLQTICQSWTSVLNIWRHATQRVVYLWQVKFRISLVRVAKIKTFGLKTPTLYAVTAEAAELNNKKILKKTPCFSSQRTIMKREWEKKFKLKKLAGSNTIGKLLSFLIFYAKQRRLQR